MVSVHYVFLRRGEAVSTDGGVNGGDGVSRPDGRAECGRERERKEGAAKSVSHTDPMLFVHIPRRERPMEVISLVFSWISRPFTRIHNGTQGDGYVRTPICYAPLYVMFRAHRGRRNGPLARRKI